MRFSDVSKQKLVFISVVIYIFTVIIFTGIVISSRVPETKKQHRVKVVDSSVDAIINQRATSKKDTAHIYYSYTMPGLLSAYRLNKGYYPASSSTGWDDFIELLNGQSAANDPITTRPSIFVENIPRQAGEVQYKLGYICADDASLIESGSKDTYAYVFINGDRHGCYGNTTGVIYQSNE